MEAFDWEPQTMCNSPDPKDQELLTKDYGKTGTMDCHHGLLMIVNEPRIQATDKKKNFEQQITSLLKH